MTMNTALLTMLASTSLALAQSCTSTTFDLTSANNGFSLVAGQSSAIQYSSSGMLITIDESNSNIALQSSQTFTAPMTLSLTMTGSSVPGMVPCMTVWDGGDTSDAIDLELMGGSTNLAMLELFRNNQNTGYGTDIGVQSFWTPQNNWDWVWNNAANNFDSSQQHTWTLNWQEGYIMWSVDGQPIVNYTKTDAPFISGSYPIRLGLWATQPSNVNWAGLTDWTANPQATTTFHSLSIRCGTSAAAAVVPPLSSSAQSQNAATSNSTASAVITVSSGTEMITASGSASHITAGTSTASSNHNAMSSSKASTASASASSSSSANSNSNNSAAQSTAVLSLSSALLFAFISLLL